MNFGFPIGFIGAGGVASVLPTFVNVGTGASATSGNVTPGLPSGSVAGDFLVALVWGFKGGAFTNTTSPTNWVRQSVLRIDEASFGWNLEVHTSITATVNPTFATSVWGTASPKAIVFGFRGVSAHELLTHAEVTASGFDVAYASITTGGPNRLVANWFLPHVSPPTTVADTGWTKQADVTFGGSSIALATTPMVALGTTPAGNHSWVDDESGTPNSIHRVSLAMIPTGG